MNSLRQALLLGVWESELLDKYKRPEPREWPGGHVPGMFQVWKIMNGYEWFDGFYVNPQLLSFLKFQELFFNTL